MPFPTLPKLLQGLVKNGGFETNDGPGYIVNNPIEDWTLINTSSTGASINAVNTLAQLQAGTNAPIPLWGISPGYVNGNGFRSGWNGGYFVIADGWPQYNSKLEQVISGLTPGGKYELRFEYAYAQQAGFDGPTNQKWTVNFGSESYETEAYDLPSHGFYAGSGTEGWLTAYKLFTPTSATQTLSFLAVGSPGVPPMSLLDGVRLFDVTPPPPPPAPVPGPLPLLGLGASLAWSRRLRQRTQRNSLR
ncbi:MAG: hypothetical protein ACK5N0_03205 [Synechococcaceae cyanobacterium]